MLHVGRDKGQQDGGRKGGVKSVGVAKKVSGQQSKRMANAQEKMSDAQGAADMYEQMQEDAAAMLLSSRVDVQTQDMRGQDDAPAIKFWVRSASVCTCSRDGSTSAQHVPNLCAHWACSHR